MLLSCPARGPFDAGRCPRCEDQGEALFGEDQRIQLSRFLSGALRHFPLDLGLEPDAEGWVDTMTLLDAARSKYGWADPTRVLAVLKLDPKGRFELDGEGGRVRATYGHSIDVALGEDPSPAPRVLYHGTAPSNLERILGEGLRPMERQEVHLSPDVQMAREVGARHAEEPVVLRVDARALVASGIAVHRAPRPSTRARASRPSTWSCTRDAEQ